MVADVSDIVFSPVIQYGFAGFSLLLLAILFWMIRKLLTILEQTNSVIAQNTTAIQDVDRRTGEELKLVRAVHDKLISRPCIAKEEH